MHDEDNELSDGGKQDIEQKKLKNGRIKITYQKNQNNVPHYPIIILTFVTYLISTIMRLSNEWFTALSENENGDLITVSGRDELKEFMESGKLKDRVEITWKYEGDEKGMPSEELAAKMEEVEEAIKKAMEKDKLAILTSVYTGGNEKVWIFYTRTTHVFGERLNEALAPFELLPINIYCEVDSDWEEYKDMYEMKQWAIE